MTAPKVLAALYVLLLLAGCTSAQKPEEADSSEDIVESDLDSESDDGVDPDLAQDELGADGDISAGGVEVTDLRYSAVHNGGTIVIRTNSRATYRLRDVPEQNQVVVEIANASLPGRLKRPYITREFNQTISAINAYQDPGSSTARFVVQLRERGRLRVEQKGNELFLAPEALASGGTIALSPAEVEDGGASGGAPENERPAPRDGLPLSGSNLDQVNHSAMRFYGKPISIEVRDTPVSQVINFISDQTGANLVVAEEVKGNITLKLKQVPWDQALLLVMKSKQLGYVRQGNVLRIAPLDVLQAENENARKVVEAQRAAEPLRVRVIPVSFSDVKNLATQVKEFLSARGKVVADVRTSSLIVTDILENLERSTNLVRALDVPPLQVQIEAKVIEARESFSRQIGVNWGTVGTGTSLGGDLSITPSLSVNPGSPLSSGMQVDFTLGQLDVLGDLDAKLSLFETDNEIKVISSPRIVAMNNETANIAQVEKVPYATAVTNGNVTTQSFNTTDVKLSLDVTPQITSSSDVIMVVSIKRDFRAAPPAGVTVPIVNTREAKTKVMVQSGQTAVIGGIYQNDTSQSDAFVPGLGKLPLIGWLFRSRTSESAKNELLLFLTPRILNSAEATVKSEEI